MPARKQAPAGGGRPFATPTWGERVHLAYRQQRTQTGRTNREIAEAIRPFHSTDQAALSRLAQHVDVPKVATTKRLAFFALLAYGYEPADFDLYEDDIPLAGLNMKKVRDQLRRGWNRIPISPNEADHSMMLTA